MKFIINKWRTEWGDACEMAKNRLLNTDPAAETERWIHSKPDSAHHSGLPALSQRTRALGFLQDERAEY